MQSSRRKRINSLLVREVLLPQKSFQAMRKEVMKKVRASINCIDSVDLTGYTSKKGKNASTSKGVCHLSLG